MNVIRVKSNFQGSNIYTTAGFEVSPFFIAVGHELAHAIDYQLNPDGYNKTWFSRESGDIVTVSEIFASHIENQIRAESGKPLRMYYANMHDVSTGKDQVNRKSKLLDNNNNALYFKQTAPSVFDVLGRGEIVNTKIKFTPYNYTINAIPYIINKTLKESIK